MRISDWSSDVCSSDLLRVMRLQYGHRLWMMMHRHTKRLGNRIRRDVVMRRPDAARREDVIIALPHLVHRRGDHLFDVENRSEELREGKEGVSTFRSRGSAYP